MTTLPKMGRPSLSGLSVKELGKPIWDRLYRQINPRPRKTSRKWWSGFSRKELGEAAYMMAYRRLVKTKNTGAK